MTMPAADAREQMIEQQVRAWDVLDPRVLETLRRVPREPYVPARYRSLAYADMEVPLPAGQHMLRPSVVGRLLAALRLAGGERILEVGTGSGFVTACLRAAGGPVLSLEIVPELADMARENLGKQHVRDIEVINADALRHELTDRFDAIALTASMPRYDTRFQEHLAVGGRLFVVVGEAPVMDARLVRRVANDAWTTESLFETVIDPLARLAPTEEFVF
jgi:protein-L-isoaspartate(D-aspartate) O-methyltransferase